MNSNVTKTKEEVLNKVENKVRGSLDSIKPSAQFVESLEKDLNKRAEILNLIRNEKMEDDYFKQLLPKNRFNFILAGSAFLVVVAIAILCIIYFSQSSGSFKEFVYDVAGIKSETGDKTDGDTDTENSLAPESNFNTDVSTWNEITVVFTEYDQWPCDPSNCTAGISQDNTGKSISLKIPQNWDYQQGALDPANADPEQVTVISNTYTKFNNYHCTDFSDSDFPDAINNPAIVTSSTFDYEFVSGKEVILDYGTGYADQTGFRYSHELCVESKGNNIATNVRFYTPAYQSDSEIETVIDTIVSTAYYTIPSTQAVPSSSQDLLYFTSTRYNMKFSYPSSWGTVLVTYRPDYYNTEWLTFSNSSWKIVYPRWEGGSANEIECASLTAASGQSGKLYCSSMDNGGVGSMTGLILDNNHIGSMVKFINVDIFSAEEMEAEKNSIAGVAGRMSFGL